MNVRSSANSPGLKKILLAALSAIIGVILLAGTWATAGPASSAAAAVPAHHGNGPKPTIVLVHGAFADASGWGGVTTRLENRGYTVLAPANPLRGVATDSAYIASVLATITGPIVLAGHSYGGEVITNAATGNPHVKALVYIAAFAPKLGETSGGILAKFPGSMLTPQNLILRPFPQPGGTTGTDAYINPAVFREAFCADCSARTAAVMAATQRPGALATLSEPSGVPAWKTIPSWYLVASQDHAIPPAAERFMAARMHARTVQINSSHAAMVSHPGAVTNLILKAARAVH
jgi:pimeloyl-ACP methyl ester carboxylesterase